MMQHRQLLTVAIHYATIAGRAAAVAEGSRKRVVQAELSRDPRATLRLRDLFSTWPTAFIIRATAVELTRDRWSSDPTGWNAAIWALDEELAPSMAEDLSQRVSIAAGNSPAK